MCFFVFGRHVLVVCLPYIGHGDSYSSGSTFILFFLPAISSCWVGRRGELLKRLFTTGNPFFGEKILGIKIGRRFGNLEGVKRGAYRKKKLGAVHLLSYRRMRLLGEDNL